MQMDIKHLKTPTLQESELKRIRNEINPIQGIFAEQERIAQMINPHRAALEEIARANQLIDHALAANGIGEQFSAMLANLAQRSQSPAIEAMEEFRRGLAQSNIAEAIGRYAMEADAFTRAIAAMHSPALGFQDQLRSITALTELHGIGHVISTMPSFDDFVASALRVDMGDWRRPLAFDNAAILDPIVRSELYTARGFDPDLTAFPASAFRDGMTSAGLYDQRREWVNDDLEDETEAAFMRTNEAHDRLMRFEYSIRMAIDEAMTRAFGPDWANHRVPETMRAAWIEKRDRGVASGESGLPLIAYADFTDYVQIIIRKDNWRDVFVSIFKHKSSVEESFRRLYPVRICTMHARPITQDDALFLLVEIKRLSKAMEFRT